MYFKNEYGYEEVFYNMAIDSAVKDRKKICIYIDNSYIMEHIIDNIVRLLIDRGIAYYTLRKNNGKFSSIYIKDIDHFLEIEVIEFGTRFRRYNNSFYFYKIDGNTIENIIPSLFPEHSKFCEAFILSDLYDFDITTDLIKVEPNALCVGTVRDLIECNMKSYSLHFITNESEEVDDYIRQLI